MLTIDGWIFEHVLLFLAGVLGYLEMLEAQAHELGLKQEEKEQQEKKLDRLKARVQELRARRDELRAKVELQEKRVRNGLLQRSDRGPLVCSCSCSMDLLRLLIYFLFLSDIQSWHPLFSVQCSPGLLDLYALRLYGCF